jgi:ABC-2 type transport system permease protein
MLRVLLWVRVRVFWNRYARAPRRAPRVLGGLAALIFGTAFVVVAGLNASLLVDRMARIDPSSPQAILPAVLLGGAVLSVITSLSTSFHHLFMSADQELLLAAPLPTRDLFVLKMLETWRDGLHILLFLCAALIGFGVAMRLPALFFGLALVVSVGLTFAATVLGTSLTLLLARVRFGGALLGASRLVSILLFLPVGVLGIPALGVARSRALPGIGQDNLQTAAATLRELGAPPAWAPTTWATHVLLGDEAALVSGVLLVGALVGLLLVALIGYEWAFQSGWERVRFAGPRTSRPVRMGWRSAGLPLAGPLLSILQKDVRTLLRDPRWRTSLLVSLVALGLPMIVLSAGGDPGPRLSQEARFWIGLFPVPYLAYVAGSQHGAASLAYEGRNLAVLRAAPVGFLRLLLAKLVGSLVLVLGITWIATLVLAGRHNATLTELLMALGVAAWLALGGTTAGLVGAALTADFETDNPQRRVGCLGTLITSGLSAMFFVTNVGLLVWLLLRAFGGIPRPIVGLAPVLDWAIVALAALAVGALGLAARLGVRRLANWEAS